jgi:hypothetical protein
VVTSAVSRATKENPNFTEVKRRSGEDNLQWLRRLLAGYTPKGIVMLLLGGTDTLAFRLRVAQAQLRHDMTPSSWSHVALVLEPNLGDIGASRVVEISLDPANGFGWAPADNAVQEGVALSRYRDPRRFPNIAVVDLPPEPPAPPKGKKTVDAKAVADAKNAQHTAITQALERFKKTRGTLDCCELVLQWLAFAWGAGQVPNPLVAGRGIPSAVLVESLAAATGFDLTPGVDSRLSCPEAIWQAALWWYEHHDQVATRRLMGAWTAEHDLVPEN